MLPGLSSISLRTQSGVRLILVVVITAVIVAACGSSASHRVPRWRAGQRARSGHRGDSGAVGRCGPGSCRCRTDPVKRGPGSNGNDAPGDNGPLIVRTGSLVARGQGRRRSRAPRPAAGSSAWAAMSATPSAPIAATTRSALITYRIPAARWDEALDALRGLAHEGDVGADEGSRGHRARWSTSTPGSTTSRSTERALQAIMAQATQDQRRPRRPEPADVGPGSDRATRPRSRSISPTRRRWERWPSRTRCPCRRGHARRRAAGTCPSSSTGPWRSCVQIGQGLAVDGRLARCRRPAGPVRRPARRRARLHARPAIRPAAAGSTGSRPGAGPGVATPMA